MYILTDNENKILTCSTTLLEDKFNNYVVNNGTLNIPKILINRIFEKNNIDEEILNNFFKYCYTAEDGFYKNPNYIEPITIEDLNLKYNNLKEKYNTLINELSKIENMEEFLSGYDREV